MPCTFDIKNLDNCKRWFQFLDEIFPNEQDKIDLLQEFYGYCLMNDCRFEKMLFLIGSGGNGKGILTSYITQVGGEYILNAEQQFLTTVYKGSQANSCLASCEGKRIVFVSEPDNGEKHSFLNIDFMKMITGRDKISARYLNKNIKEFEPLFITFLSCNTKPEIRKLDQGILRRLSIHPFVCEFRDDPNPLNKL